MSKHIPFITAERGGVGVDAYAKITMKFDPCISDKELKEWGRRYDSMPSTNMLAAMALERVEWSGRREWHEGTYMPCCPACEGVKPDAGFDFYKLGHSVGCFVYEALKALKGDDEND